MANTEFNMSDSLPQEEAQSFSLQELINKYLFHWPVFLLGLIICLSGAFIYLRYAQPVYSISSKLLIKDDKKGGVPSSGDLLNELDLFSTSKVVDNEIEILKSKTLMRKVVDRLNLSVSFRTEGRVKFSDLYSSKPVDLLIIQMDSTLYGKALELTLLSSENYRLEDKDSGRKVSGRFSELQKNIFGTYRIEKNANYKGTTHSAIELTIYDPAIVTDQCLTQLSVALASKQSTVLNLNFQSTNPERGQDVLNTLVQVYNEAALADKNKTTQSTIEFIDERLKLITGELTEVERDVESFKSSRGLTDISSDANLYLDNVRVNDEKLSEINLKLSVVAGIQRYVNSNSVGEKLPSTLGIDDPVLLGQINRLAELQLQRDQLLATTTTTNPIVAPLTKQIETIREGVKTSIGNILNTLRVSKAELDENNAQFRGSITKIPGQERQLISIKRQQTIKESLYLYLLQKKEEASLSYASSVADSRIVDLAFFSKTPISPKRQLVYLSGLLLGFFLPAAYLHAKQAFNNRVERSTDISKYTETPLLGEIAYSDEKKPIVVYENSRKAIAEQFRSIRTNMQFLGGTRVEGEGRVTLFTSGMSGEGKTFVASNLAAALAFSGRRTVLIELDLRKPKVSKYLSISNRIGISNYLIGQVKINDILQPSGVNQNLLVIGSGPIPPNPSELLIQKEMDLLISFLKKQFDEIIIDSPPIGLVTDAQILGRLSDITIYMVRQGVTFKEQVKNLDSLYRSNKLPKLNVILNGVELGGQYGYGYGYGYYSDDLRVEKFSFITTLKNILKRF